MPSRQPLSATVPSYPRLKLTAIFIAITTLSSLITLFAISYFLYYLWYSVLRRSATSPLFDSNTPLVKLRRFSYAELKSATHGFSPGNAIGKGGSGTVFRGSLKDGKSVAVKLLDSSSLESERDFQNELQILGGIKSGLVVSLVGYCVEKRKRLVVYDYMPNRSLQELLFSETNSGLDWGRRFGIISDVAKALSFLHLECNPPVVHGDVKPSNVLLDSEFKAKLSDFGLSRLKTDFVGVDLFSQEIGAAMRSPQDLSGNLGTTPTPLEESRDDEVDFAMALQASSSSIHNSFKNSQNIRAPGLNSMNYNAVFDADDKITTGKGKTVEKDWNYDDNDDDDDEVSSSIGHEGNELDLSNNGVSGGSIIDHSMLQGRDWWWRQDVSGELCSKDYVMEWIGTQIFHSANPNWDEEGKGSVGCEEEEANQTGIPVGKELLELQNKKPRMMKEWWKEEHLDELCQKKKKSVNGNNPNKTKCIRSIRFKVPHFDLGKHFTFMAQSSERRCDLERELSFRRGSKKKKKKKRKKKQRKESHCVGGGSDAWSTGDLFSRELSSTTSMRGTLCYVAPEYGRSAGFLMEKGDIYSLGVLILVVVSGRRPLHVLNSPMKLERANLVSWCKHLAHSGDVLELVDERLGGEYSKDEARLCVNLALACLQRVPELRPDIGDIVKILSGEMCLSSLRFDFLPSPPSKLLHRSMRRQKRNAELGFRM